MCAGMTALFLRSVGVYKAYRMLLIEIVNICIYGRLLKLSNLNFSVTNTFSLVWHTCYHHD